MIIWSGLGKMVPATALICLFIFVPLGVWLGKGNGGAATGVAVAGLAAAFLLHLTLKGAEKQAAAAVAAGQPAGETEPGSFFFISSKTWVFLLPVAGLVLAFLTMNQPPGS